MVYNKTLHDYEKRCGLKINLDKYLVLDCTDKNNEVLTKYTNVWHKTKYLIKIINDGKTGEYERDFMKIKCN